MPTETTALALSATLERLAVPLTASEQHAVLSVVAPPASTDRAPVSLVAVLDRSGSMGGEKLRLVLATMRFMLQHLRPQDKLGVVSYDTFVRTDAPLTLCDEAGKQRLEQALSGIRAGSTTNLSGGLLEGLALHSGRSASDATFGNTYTRRGGYPQLQLQQQVQQVQQRMPPKKQMRRQVPPPQQAGDSDSDGSGAPVQQQARRSSFLGSVSNTLSNAFGGFGAPPPPPQLPGPPPVAVDAEWAVELRCAPELVRSVQFTVGEEVVEVAAAPFRLARSHAGGALPLVRAKVTLATGVVVNLEHQVVARDRFLPVRFPALAPAPVEAGVVRSTLLFTDGLANAGIQDTEGICAAARQELGESAAKSTIHTFGYGRDHNAEMLRAIALVGDGEYFFIESQDNVADSFGEAIGGLLSTTHQAIQLAVHGAPGVQVEALTTFQQDVEDGVTTVTLGDLFAEERRDVLLRFSVPAGDAAQALASVTLRAYCLQKQAFEEIGPIALEVQRSAVDEQANPEVRKHVNRRVATAAMDAARTVADTDLAQARAQLEAAEAQLAPHVGGCVLTQGLVADLQSARDSMQRQREYAEMGSKKLALMSKMHGKQRACAYEGSAATEMYSGSAQRAMKCAFKSAIR